MLPLRRQHRSLRRGIYWFVPDGRVSGKRAGDDDTTWSSLDYVRQRAMHVLDNRIDVQVRYPVDGRCISSDQITADIGPGITGRITNAARFTQDGGYPFRTTFGI